MNVTVIGVAGGTGSGKSTLVKRLQEAFKEEEVVTLCHDYYYKAHPELTYEERTKLNCRSAYLLMTSFFVLFVGICCHRKSAPNKSRGAFLMPVLMAGIRVYFVFFTRRVSDAA